MSTNIEKSLEQKGLRRVSELSEVLDAAFLIDTIPRSASDKDGETIPVYPVTKKRNLANRVLNLYGTHWRYRINSKDWEDVEKQDGDTETVLREIRQSTKKHRHALYAFTQRSLDQFNSLWIFVPETEGWEYQQRVLVPKFDSDLAGYKSQKRAAMGKS